jgi:hypothetical protein
MREILSRPETILSIFLSAPVFALPFTNYIRKMAGKRDRWKCVEPDCNKRFQDGWMVEIDHIIPESEGGENELYNAQTLCLEHHYTKHFEDGEIGAANLILQRLTQTGGRTREWIRRNK